MLTQSFLYLLINKMHKIQSHSYKSELKFSVVTNFKTEVENNLTCSFLMLHSFSLVVGFEHFFGQISVAFPNIEIYNSFPMHERQLINATLQKNFNFYLYTVTK